MGTAHGYIPYTHGCRCALCRAAKADYQRAKRQAGYALANAVAAPGDGPPINRVGRPIRSGSIRYVAPGVRHGSATSYVESSCRCLDCTRAATAKRRAERESARSASAS